MFTKRFTPKRTAASRTLKVAIRLVRNTTCGGLPVGSGIAATCTTASAPRMTANASPASVRSAIWYRAVPSARRSNPGRVRSVARTSWPASSSAWVAARPTLPWAPVITTFMIAPLFTKEMPSGHTLGHRSTTVLAPHVQCDRTHDDHSAEHLLPVGGDAEEDEGVLDEQQKSRAERGSQDPADAPEEARAADHGRADGEQLVAVSGRRLSDAQSGRLEDSRHGGEGG